jgi:prepilin-type N-terminal cleavage/methylation domain-containing protein
MQRSCSRSSAFTLIELLVAVALLVILTGVVVFVFSKAVRIFILADARAQIYQNVRAGVDMIRRDLMTSEPLVRADDVTSNQQRLRIVNGSYPNTKWSTTYSADTLQIWNLKSTMNTGATGSVYAKYWLDWAANQEVPILKRFITPVNTNPGSAWLTSDDPVTTATTDVREELMQYVVGFDVEPYYSNIVAPVARDPHWNLDSDANAGGGNEFRDASDTPAWLYIVQTNTSGIDQFPGVSPYTGGANPILDISSLSTTIFARKGAFSAGAPTQFSPVPTPANLRQVPALPRAFRITFYVRDEHSNEQRAIQQTIWMPMWGS